MRRLENVTHPTSVRHESPIVLCRVPVGCFQPERRKGGQPGSRLAALLCPAVLWLAGRATALAQEDFRSTLALDRIEAQYQNPPVELRPDPPRLGPVQLSLGLYTGAEFNDNINLAPVNAQSNVILRGGVSLGAALPATERSTLRLSANIGYVHYLHYSAYDGLEVSPNSALTYDLEFTRRDPHVV